jgi:hypothetical protein
MERVVRMARDGHFGRLLFEVPEASVAAHNHPPHKQRKRFGVHKHVQYVIAAEK